MRKIVVGVANALHDHDLPGAVPVGELREAWVQSDRSVEVERVVDGKRGPQLAIVRIGVRDHGADAVVATRELDEDHGVTRLARLLRRVGRHAHGERTCPRVDGVATGDDGAHQAQSGKELAPAEFVVEIQRASVGHRHTTAYSGDATMRASRRVRSDSRVNTSRVLSLTFTSV